MNLRSDKPAPQVKVASKLAVSQKNYAALNCTACGEKLHYLFISGATLAYCPGADLPGLERLVERMRHAGTQDRCVVSCREA